MVWRVFYSVTNIEMPRVLILTDQIFTSKLDIPPKKVTEGAPPPVGGIDMGKIKTEEVSADNSAVIHADTTETIVGEPETQRLVIQAGQTTNPSTSNVSEISMGGSTSNTENQNITIKTQGTERVKIDSDGHSEFKGGVVTNDGEGEMACKRYSNVVTIAPGVSNKEIQLVYSDAAFYGRVITQLRETTNVSNISTMILEFQGGTSDGTESSVPIAVGIKKLFGGVNANPWSPIVTTTSNTVTITPANTTGIGYSYDIFSKIHSSLGGKLIKIKSGGTDLKSFTY